MKSGFDTSYPTIIETALSSIHVKKRDQDRQKRKALVTISSRVESCFKKRSAFLWEGCYGRRRAVIRILSVDFCSELIESAVILIALFSLVNCELLVV